MHEFQFTLLFWSSTTAQQPTLKFSGIRQQWFYFALRFCGSDIWIRQSRDVLLVSVPQCLGAKLGRPEWVRLIQIAGLVSSGDFFTHGSERLNPYHLHVSCPSQKFKGSWNYWDHSSFCLLGKDWAGTPLKRLWISVMEKQCWLDIRFKLTSGHTGDRYWVLNYPGILWQVRAIKNVS